ncbi:AAA family ATPase, partial [Myxococcota bacterium]|nr:AAA family ATPase [Myxococcota bacterium]
TLTDNNGRKVDFRQVILIMTTNAGAQQMASGGIGFGAKEESGSSKGAIERIFAPEFRNRLDAIVTFQHLPMEVIEQVVEKLIAELEEQLKAKKVRVELDAEARRWLAETGYDRKHGARPLARLIDREIRRPLADDILFGDLKKGGVVHISVKKNVLSLKSISESNTP